MKAMPNKRPQPAVAAMSATDHELIERYGYRETLIGVYPNHERAVREKQIREEIYRRMRIDHGTLIVRRSY